MVPLVGNARSSLTPGYRVLPKMGTGETPLVLAARLSRVDAQRLKQALLNLLSNAHRYGREGGTIRLSLARRPSEVVLAVADDGPGIAAADQERIFERYYRSERGRHPSASMVSVREAGLIVVISSRANELRVHRCISCIVPWHSWSLAVLLLVLAGAIRGHGRL
jgi:hypothetical protein